MRWWWLSPTRSSKRAGEQAVPREQSCPLDEIAGVADRVPEQRDGARAQAAPGALLLEIKRTGLRHVRRFRGQGVDPGAGPLRELGVSLYVIEVSVGRQDRIEGQAPGRERLIRFAYTTTGSGQLARARRGPVTMRARDIERLRAALERAPVLKEALGL